MASLEAARKMRNRLLIPELMDDPQLSESEHLRALRDLRRLNCWSGTARAAWRPIRELALSLNVRTLSVLDIATGSADVPVNLSRYAEAIGITLDIDACDLSQRALEMAAGSLPEGSAINLFPLDITADAITGQYDVVMCTTFLHHLSEVSAVSVLEKMRAAARKRVVIVDLERSGLNWLLVTMACRLASRSKIVHFDGPQSVRAAFTVSEVRRLVREAGFRRFRITRRWPCRFVLSGDI